MTQIFSYGDNIDTDRIIPGKYTKTLDQELLASHVFEDLDSSFKDKVQPGDIVVAGENFGCGSSREQAATAIKASGVELVVAKSFARIFFRNAINIGLPVMEIPGHQLTHLSQVRYSLSKGLLWDGDREYRSVPLPGFILNILEHGGLVPFLKNNHSVVSGEFHGA